MAGALSQASLFRASTTVVVIYLVVATALLLAMVFQPSGVGAWLADGAAVFTVTLIVGMVAISLYIVHYVIKYDPTMVFVPVNPVSCPDFYNLTMSDDPNVTLDQRATCTATTVYGGQSTGPINATAGVTSALKDGNNCRIMYPIALVNNEKDPYDMRQAFSQQCGVPWTDNLGNFTLLKYNQGNSS